MAGVKYYSLFSVALYLDQGSLSRLEDFFMAVLVEMKPDRHCWFAFQPNTLKDFNPNLPKNWLEMVNNTKLKTNLKKISDSIWFSKELNKCLYKLQ